MTDMEQMDIIQSNRIKSIGYYIRTVAVILICAAIVLGFRLGYIPVATFTVSGIPIPLSDFFIILGAGLCGYQYGLGMFLIVFFTEIAMGRSDIISLFPLFLYLILALTSGYAAKNRWYASVSRTLLVALILEIELGNIFYLIFVYIFGGAETGYVTTLIGTLPEILLSVLSLYLYYRFVPDKIKKSLGQGFMYASDYKAEVKDKLHLGRHITVLSLAEGFVFAIIAVLLSESLFGVLGDSLVMPENVSRFVLRVAVFLLALTLSISVVVIINEIIIGIIVDVVRKQDSLETALKVSEAGSEAKSAFLSSMSHEIRTPINAVLGMDEMIMRDTKEEKTYEYAENIRVAGNTLLGLINDVLDFSKIEAGKMEIIPSEYDLSSMIHDLVTMISTRAQNKNLGLEIRVNENIPSVLFGDEIRIKQVITNILTNAVKYTEEGSVTLSVSYEKTGADTVRLYVSVSDTGIGIKEEDIGKLFSAFERIEEERNKNIEGTGLGMSITTRLLAMMNSKLDVKSVYGEGSTFSFEIIQRVISWEPIGDYEKRWKTMIKAGRSSAGITFTAPGAHILAVDDMPMNLSVLTGLLKPTGMRIDTAESGEECLKLIGENKYDLIFLDHRMPGMDGVETLTHMKKDFDDYTVPVIALTANAVSGAREEYIGYGFTDYLTKPVSYASLVKILREYLPKDKIVEGQEACVGDESDEMQAAEIQLIDGLDLDYAMLHIPDRVLLNTAIMDFLKTVDVYADRLCGIYEQLPEKHAFDDYRILVHGMKGNAATIGIIPLAGMAKLLENAAADEDQTVIRHLHDDFIIAWRAYKKKISEATGAKESSADKHEYDAEAIIALLEIIRMAMEDFDVDRADEAMRKLEGFSVPENMRDELSILAADIVAVDDDGVFESIGKIRKSMEDLEG